MNKYLLLKVKSSLFIVGLIFIFLLSSCGGGSALFKSQSKKGPNIYSSKPPRTKSRSKLYGHSVSKKRIKGKRGSIFSSKKKRYGSVTSGSKGGKDKGAKSSKGGRKSGKGRKKDK
ncbi:MAG: hypothetical protein JKX68_13700 [Flavobacteriales bacterium]|nr:hypothetical protein [Flavobacteriales bacterium]